MQEEGTLVSQHKAPMRIDLTYFPVWRVFPVSGITVSRHHCTNKRCKPIAARSTSILASRLSEDPNSISWLCWLIAAKFV